MKTTSPLVIIVLLLIVLPGLTLAHEDSIAPLLRVDHIYDAPEPLGEIHVTYRASRPAAKNDQGQEIRPARPTSLTLKCDLFDATIPAALLDDLPRPDWSRMFTAYSLTNFEGQKQPYVYISIPLHGPVGVSWQQTWVTFHFDEAGKLERQIKRFIPRPATNSVHVLWEPWPAGVTAQSILEAKTPR